MKLKENENGYYQHYQKQALESSLANDAFNYANDYANHVEELVEKGVKLEEAFASGYQNVDCSKLTGSQKHAACTILNKVWEYGSELLEYQNNLYFQQEEQTK